MSVFENLGEEKAKEMIDELISKGYSEDEAFTEVYSIECNMDEEELIYDVCVYGYVYIIEADNENEAKIMACDTYYEETGLKAYTDDEAVVWKIHGEYPYEWQ